jgi:hypothetical protein
MPWRQMSFPGRADTRTCGRITVPRLNPAGPRRCPGAWRWTTPVPKLTIVADNPVSPGHSPRRTLAWADVQRPETRKPVAGAGAQRPEPRKPVAGPGAQQHAPRRAVARAGARLRQPRRTADGAGARRGAPRRTVAGTSARRREPRRAVARASAQHREPRRIAAGAGAQRPESWGIVAGARSGFMRTGDAFEAPDRGGVHSFVQMLPSGSPDPSSRRRSDGSLPPQATGAVPSDHAGALDCCPRATGCRVFATVCGISTVRTSIAHRAVYRYWQESPPARRPVDPAVLFGQPQGNAKETDAWLLTPDRLTVQANGSRRSRLRALDFLA